MGESLGFRRTLVMLVQLRARPQVASRDSCDGRWNQRSHPERAGTAHVRFL